MVEQNSAVKALRAREWDDLTAAERLQRNTLDALTVTRDILARPLNWDKLKEVSIVKDAALSATALQARVDEMILRPARSADGMENLLARLRAGDGAQIVDARPDGAAKDAAMLAPAGPGILAPRAAQPVVTSAVEIAMPRPTSGQVLPLREAPKPKRAARGKADAPPAVAGNDPPATPTAPAIPRGTK